MRPSDDELRRHLDEVLLTGEVVTPRESNLGNLKRLARREPAHLYGVDVAEHWTFESLLALMVDRVGIDPDPFHQSGQDRIDGAKTVAKLAEYRARFRRAIASGDRILFATAHPATLLPVYQRLAAHAAAAGTGATVIDLNRAPFAHISGIRVALDDPHQLLWCTGGVTSLYRGGSLLHTHAAEPMNALLDALEASGDVPDFVVADHGWAGAAGRRGYPTIAIADCNDPAVFVAEAQGSVEVAVPIDDGVAVHLYEPVIAYLLDEG